MIQKQEYSITKKPHSLTAYTKEQLLDFAQCTDPDHGYEYFLSNHFYIQHPIKGRIQYKPFEYQKQLIYNYHNYRFTISLLSRQTGKTTSAAGYLLWFAMFIPDSTILIAAHKYTGAQEIMQRIRYAYENCPDHIRAGTVTYNKGSIDFDNGSRIISQTTTETTGRGLSISLLYCDEFSFVRPTIASEFWTSISPTLSTGGKAIITSTPNSDEDQFATIWKQANKQVDEFGNETELGINGFKPFMATWEAHPERDEQWAKEELGRIGDERFRREHKCEFIIFDETLVNPLLLAELRGTDPIEKQGQIRWYKKPNKDLVYLIGLDPSLGTGGDAAAIEVFELPDFKQVAEWQHNRTPIQNQVLIMADIIKQIAEVVPKTNIYYTVENNTLGEAALISIAEYGEDNISGIFLSEPARTGSSRRYRKGFNTNSKSKLAACAKFKSLLESKRFNIYSKNLLSELKTFVALGGSYQAKIGENDDLIMATLLTVRMAQLLQDYDAELDAKLRDGIDNMVEPLPFVMLTS